MSENETPEPKRSNVWLAASTCSALALIAAIGLAFPLREQLLAQVQTTSRSEATAREKLASEVAALQSSLANASTQANPNDEAIASLTAKLAEVTTKLDALGARIEALEKKPEPAPIVVAPPPPAPPAPPPTPAATPVSENAALKLAALSGKPFAVELAAWQKLHPDANEQAASLSAVAESGILSEAQLNDKLRDALDAANAKQRIDDTSLAGKINAHLSGLVSIRKARDTGPYAELRRDVLRDDSATLIREVEALDTLARQPFEGWLKLAYARRDALTALNALDTGTGH